MRSMDPRSWWRKLPQKKRVELIAAVLLIFAGAEILVLAPYVLELAFVIDAFGLVFVFSAAAASIRMSMLSAKRLFWRAVVTPVLSAIRTVEAFSDFGARIPSAWLIRLLRADAIASHVVAVGIVTLLFARVAYSAVTALCA